MGSTSIPGCVAKPILDLSVVYDQSTDLSDETVELVSLGFTSKGEYGIPGREYFTYYDAEEKYDYIHIHANLEGHPNSVAYETFKEALLSNAVNIAEYSELKQNLVKSGIDRKEYPAAKTDVILGILARHKADPSD